MCIFNCMTFSQEICHHSIYPQEVVNKKTPWVLAPFTCKTIDLGHHVKKGKYLHLMYFLFRLFRCHIIPTNLITVFNVHQQSWFLPHLAQFSLSLSFQIHIFYFLRKSSSFLLFEWLLITKHLVQAGML